MIPAVAIVIALLCATASARRVWLAANATALHPDVVHAALRGNRGSDALARLRALVLHDPRAEWERELFDALDAPAEARVARINEQLTELDYRIQRWARVPRVCASIATSSGFMLGTLVLRSGLVMGDFDPILDDLLTRGPIAEALMVAAMGLVGTAFCIGAQAEATRIAKATTKAVDKMVERLEELVPAVPGVPAQP